MNSTSCLTTTLLVTLEVVGSWKMIFVSSIQIQLPLDLIHSVGVSGSLCQLVSVVMLFVVSFDTSSAR